MKKKLMAWLLVICLVLGLMPTALAANAGWPDAAVSADATVTLSSDKADVTPVTIQAGATLVVESDQPGTMRTITYAGTEPLFVVEAGGHLVLDSVTITGNTGTEGAVVVKTGGLLDLGYNDKITRTAPSITGNGAKNLVVAEGAKVRLNNTPTQKIGLSFLEDINATNPQSLMQGGRYTIQQSDLAAEKIAVDNGAGLELVLKNDNIVLHPQKAKVLYWYPENLFGSGSGATANNGHHLLALGELSGRPWDRFAERGAAVTKVIGSQTAPASFLNNSAITGDLEQFDFIYIAPAVVNRIAQDAPEVTALRTYLDKGGRIFIQAEDVNFTSINDAAKKLANYLGAAFDIINNDINFGTRVVSGNSELSAGIGEWGVAKASMMTTSDPNAKVVFQTKETTPRPFCYDITAGSSTSTIPWGNITVSADGNIWEDSAQYPFNWEKFVDNIVSNTVSNRITAATGVNPNETFDPQAGIEGGTDYRTTSAALGKVKNGETVVLKKDVGLAPVDSELLFNGATLKDAQNNSYAAIKDGTKISMDENGSITLNEGDLKLSANAPLHVTGSDSKDHLLSASAGNPTVHTPRDGEVGSEPYVDGVAAGGYVDIDGVRYYVTDENTKVYIPSGLRNANGSQNEAVKKAEIPNGVAGTVDFSDDVKLATPAANAGKTTIVSEGTAAAPVAKITVEKAGDKLTVNGKELTTTADNTVILVPEKTLKEGGVSVPDNDKIFVNGKEVATTSGGITVDRDDESNASIRVPAGKDVTVNGYTVKTDAPNGVLVNQGSGESGDTTVTVPKKGESFTYEYKDASGQTVKQTVTAERDDEVFILNKDGKLISANPVVTAKTAYTIRFTGVSGVQYTVTKVNDAQGTASGDQPIAPANITELGDGLFQIVGLEKGCFYKIDGGKRYGSTVGQTSLVDAADIAQKFATAETPNHDPAEGANEKATNSKVEVTVDEDGNYKVTVKDNINETVEVPDTWGTVKIDLGGNTIKGTNADDQNPARPGMELVKDNGGQNPGTNLIISGNGGSIEGGSGSEKNPNGGAGIGTANGGNAPADSSITIENGAAVRGGDAATDAAGNGGNGGNGISGAVTPAVNGGSVAGGSGANGGNTSGSDAGNGGNGGAGIAVDGKDVTVNGGTISGGAAGNGGSATGETGNGGAGGTGGSGIVSGNGSIDLKPGTNVSGGNAGDGGSSEKGNGGAGGNGGTGTEPGTGTVENSGSIAGGDAGKGGNSTAGNGGNAGNGGTGSTGNVNNNGQIGGGNGADGGKSDSGNGGAGGNGGTGTTGTVNNGANGQIDGGDAGTGGASNSGNGGQGGTGGNGTTGTVTGNGGQINGGNGGDGGKSETGTGGDAGNGGSSGSDKGNGNGGNAGNGGSSTNGVSGNGGQGGQGGETGKGGTDGVTGEMNYGKLSSTTNTITIQNPRTGLTYKIYDETGKEVGVAVAEADKNITFSGLGEGRKYTIKVEDRGEEKLVGELRTGVTPPPEPTPNPIIPILPGILEQDQWTLDSGVSNWLNTSYHSAYMSGMGGNRFAPNANMTRGQVAQMFYNLLINKNVQNTARFTDVNANRYYATAVNTLASMGIVTGSNGKFRPDDSITRAEFVAIAMRFANRVNGAATRFSDVGYNAWYYDAVASAVAYGWIGGYSDGTFRPNKAITRAEVVTIVNRMLNRSFDAAVAASRVTRFADVPTSHWAYQNISEATTAHYHTERNGLEHWN